MGIKLTTPRAEIYAEIERQAQRINEATVRTLAYIGEQAVNRARDWTKKSNDFTDQTGNLRSSIGYVVVHDGQPVKVGDFNQVKFGSGGTTDGRAYAESLAGQFQKGYTLVIVAGMEYASYVQNRGYDVLRSAELLADQLAEKMLTQLKQSLNKK